MDFGLIIKGLIVAAAIGIGIGIKYVIPGTKNDNPIEQIAEDVIKDETGIVIDLTPEEKGK